MDAINLEYLRKENFVENIQDEHQDKNSNSADIIHHCQYRGALNGKIIFTNYRLIFAGDSHGFSTLFIASVPYNSINKVSKSPHRTTNTKNLLNSSEQSPLVVEIECKDFRTLKFDFKDDNGDKSKFHNNVSQRAFGNIERLFCFVKTSQPSENWFIYDVHKEFDRQTKNLQSKGEWIVSEENKDFGLCDTYPKESCFQHIFSYLVVPKTDKEKVNLQKVASYRSRNRLPVATWIHPTNGAAITRCSQPLVGVTERRCGDDYLYLKKIRDLRVPEANKLLIYDCRPKVNAQANRAKGGGYESHDSYEEHGGTTFIERIFCDIDNIHVMRDSLVKVIEALNNPNKKSEKKWFELLDDSKWMQHLRLILIASNRVVDRIKNNGHSTLIHCSDGWDRTAQLAAVSQLCLDGYYRTLEGFLVLIDKEWCAFGHKFQDRIGHTVNKPQDTERSPVFIQFLDAVYQLMCQFPEAFEFSERLLIFIAEHLFSARFGNFLFNNVKDRLAHNLHTKTGSIWSFILHQDNRRQFLHPIYDQNSHLITLVPNSSVIRMTFWIRLYNKANPSTPRDQLLEWALKMQQRNAEKNDATNM